MPITCQHCSKHFPTSDEIGSRHKSVCSGWQASIPKFPPCLCGYAATSKPAMSRHRRGCDLWASRDRNRVRSARVTRTLQDRYGVDSFRQIPGLEERRKETILEKYGAENVFSKESVLYDDIEAKRSGKRGCFPQGEANPMVNPELRAKQMDSLFRNYGVRHPLQSFVIKERFHETCQERYGLPHGMTPECKERIRQTNLLRYGGPAPASSLAVRAKMQITNLRWWGTLHTGESFVVHQKKVETNRARYGADHIFQNPILFKPYLERFSLPGPNKLEARFASHFPDILYTGDGGFWRWLPKLGHHKNPDFIVPGPDPEHPRKGVTKVVELFGDYWHSRMFTGKANFDHEQELLEAYRDIGIECLIVWESAVRERAPEVIEQVQVFLRGPSSV